MRPLPLRSHLILFHSLLFSGALAVGPGCASETNNIHETADANDPCVSCHTIDGDGGREGPDLTHAAKSRDRTAAWFRRWITDPGLVNPDAEMPAFGGKLSDAELTAIAEYLAKTLGR